MPAFDPSVKKTISVALGVFLTVAGVTLVLREWSAVVIVFKGFIGVILAVAGLVMLCMAGGSSFGKKKG